MKIIISPAKKMNCDDQGVAPQTDAVYLDRAQEVLDWFKGLDYQKAQALWKCSDAIAQDSFERMKSANLRQAQVPAILAYEGIAFKYMAPQVFEGDQFSYVQDHLRILSGLYGLVRPMDGVIFYRLEMQSKARIAGTRDLYEYWGESIYQQVMDKDRVVINLASKEYSKTVEKYLQPGDTFITCTFGQLSGEKITQKGVYCKMARGEMVRYMAQHDVTEPEQLKDFDSPNWTYSESHSTSDHYVFLQNS